MLRHFLSEELERGASGLQKVKNIRKERKSGAAEQVNPAWNAGTHRGANSFLTTPFLIYLLGNMPGEAVEDG